MIVLNTNANFQDRHIVKDERDMQEKMKVDLGVNHTHRNIIPVSNKSVGECLHGKESSCKLVTEKGFMGYQTKYTFLSTNSASVQYTVHSATIRQLHVYHSYDIT